jgi:hypothetical protein
MPRFPLVYFASLALSAGTVLAQSPGEYALDQGFITFSAPPEWPVIMQKTEGTPQFVAFQVKDPADVGSGETSRVTVETKLLNDAGNFQAMVNRDVDKAKQLPDYAQRTDGVDSDTLRYFARNGKTRYEYRETWYLNGHLLVHVRCVRPMLAKTTAQWTAAYESGCLQIMRSLKPH